MAKKIGEALIEQGLLTKKQLNQALRYQLIVGGHLGTSLIELGLIDENSLGRTLAQLMNLRYADAEVLRNIPRSVIQRVPAEIVEQHHVVPIRQRGRTMHFAVISPAQVTTLSSRTGYKIVPWIAPEIRVLEAMERYYNIPRRARYLGIAAALDPTQPGGVARRPLMDGSLSAVDESLLHAPQEECQVELSMEGSEGDYGESWRDVADRLFNEEPQLILEPAIVEATRRPSSPQTASATSPPAPETTRVASMTESPVPKVEASSRTQARPRTHAQPPAPAPTPRKLTLEEVAHWMSQADSREELVSTLLTWLEPHLSASVVFGVKSKSAYVWDWRGIEMTPDKAVDLEFPIPTGSVFELLLGNESFHGPVPDSASCRKFYAALHRRPPAKVLLHPIYLHDRLVAILYGEGDAPAALLARTEEFEQVLLKFSLALHMVILKRKIRALG